MEALIDWCKIGNKHEVFHEKRSRDLQWEIDCILLKLENETLKQKLYEAEKTNPITCPITLEPILKLVVCTSDGYFYERSAIESWCKLHARSPMTQQALHLNDLCNATNIHHHITTTHNQLKQEQTTSKKYKQILVTLRKQQQPHMIVKD